MCELLDELNECSNIESQVNILRNQLIKKVYDFSENADWLMEIIHHFLIHYETNSIFRNRYLSQLKLKQDPIIVSYNEYGDYDQYIKSDDTSIFIGSMTDTMDKKGISTTKHSIKFFSEYMDNDEDLKVSRVIENQIDTEKLSFSSLSFVLYLNFTSILDIIHKSFNVGKRYIDSFVNIATENNDKIINDSSFPLIQKHLSSYNVWLEPSSNILSLSEINSIVSSVISVPCKVFSIYREEGGRGWVEDEFKGIRVCF